MNSSIKFQLLSLPYEVIQVLTSRESEIYLQGCYQRFMYESNWIFLASKTIWNELLDKKNVPPVD